MFSQPLASEVGAQVLRNDGNAADACIAMSAVLSVTEPCSTGVGGDAFCIFYDSKNSKTYILNGSGKSSRNVSLVEAKSVAGKSPTLPETSKAFFRRKKPMKRMTDCRSVICNCSRSSSVLVRCCR